MDQLSAVLKASLDRLTTAAPGWVVAALALYIVSLFIVGARWRGFVRMVGADIGRVRATLATLGGIAVGNLTPSSRLAGEACRIALGRLNSEIAWSQIAVATAWDRISEIPALIVLCGVAAFAVRHVMAAQWPWIAAAAIAGGIGVFAVRRIRRRRRGRGLVEPEWLRHVSLERCDIRVFAAGVGWSALLWLQDVLRLTCAALAFGVTLSPSRVATLAVLAMVGGLVPTVGGIGAVEGGLMGGLIAFGVEVPTAAAITAVERAISFGFSTTAGALVVMLLGGRSLATALWTRDPTARWSVRYADLPSRTSESGSLP